MSRKATPTVTLIVMFMVAFFTVFLSVKQFSVFKNQVYQEAYYGIN
jgi:hypothetical protein